MWAGHGRSTDCVRCGVTGMPCTGYGYTGSKEVGAIAIVGERCSGVATICGSYRDGLSGKFMAEIIKNTLFKEKKWKNIN